MIQRIKWRLIDAVFLRNVTAASFEGQHAEKGVCGREAQRIFRSGLRQSSRVRYIFGEFDSNFAAASKRTCAQVPVKA